LVNSNFYAIRRHRRPAYLSNIVEFNTAESRRRQLYFSTTNAAFLARSLVKIRKR